MNIEKIKEWHSNLQIWDADTVEYACDAITFLLAECQKWQGWHDCEYRERKKYRQDANYFAGEVQRLTAALAERDAEVERLKERGEKWKTTIAKLVATKMLLTAKLQSAEKRVAGDCASLAETFRSPPNSHPLLSGAQIGEIIRQKYGV